MIFAPIERLKERYSDQWFGWHLAALKALDIPFTIVGDINQHAIREGQFLDVTETCDYKAHQFLNLVNELRKRPTFSGVVYFMDGWNPMVTMLDYIRTNMKMKFKIVGVLHAGTWDPYDFLSANGCGSWGKFSEMSWMKSFDRILVATNFHKRMILDYFTPYFEESKDSYEMDSKFRVVDFPCYRNDEKAMETKKENLVVFPHRLAREKRPQDFDDLEFIYRRMTNDHETRFVRTKDACTSKEDYYDLLAKAKVVFSSALQETFGIAMLEGVALGAVPVAPNRLSYVETLPAECLYLDLKHAAKMVWDAIMKYEEKVVVPRHHPDAKPLVSAAMRGWE